MRATYFFILALSTLLTGCASTITSEVTAFHEWSGSAQQTYRFEATPLQVNDLEYRSYENLLKTALMRVGLEEATGNDADLNIKFAAKITPRDVRVIETVLVDSWYGTPWYGPGYGYPYWSGWSGYGHPLYGRNFPSMPVPRDVERRYTVFQRELKISMVNAKSGLAVYEVTVRSDGAESNLAKLMPYFIESALQDFPSKSGTPRVITLPVKK